MRARSTSQIVARTLQLQILAAQILIPPIEGVSLLVERLFFLLDASLDAVDFLAPLREFAVEIRAEAHSLVFRLESSVAASGFCFLQDTVGLCLDLADVRIGTPLQVPPCREKGGNDDERGLEDAEDDGLGVHRHP